MPIADCASSRSPSAMTRGSVLRTRGLPKRLVSPPSPVRVVTRALVREPDTRDRIGARGAMLVRSGGFHRMGGSDAKRPRRSERQEQEEEVERGARARAPQEGPLRSRPADDLRGDQAEAQGKSGLVTRSREKLRRRRCVSKPAPFVFG